jgi:hypothetical protein
VKTFQPLSGDKQIYIEKPKKVYTFKGVSVFIYSSWNSSADCCTCISIYREKFSAIRWYVSIITTYFIPAHDFSHITCYIFETELTYAVISNPVNEIIAYLPWTVLPDGEGTCAVITSVCLSSPTIASKLWLTEFWTIYTWEGRGEIEASLASP